LICFLAVFLICLLAAKSASREWRFLLYFYIPGVVEDEELDLVAII